MTTQKAMENFNSNKFDQNNFSSKKVERFFKKRWVKKEPSQPSTVSFRQFYGWSDDLPRYNANTAVSFEQMQEKRF